MTVPIFQRVVAAFQIIGSSSAAVLILGTLFESKLNIVTILIVVPLYALFAVAFLSGIWLWNNEERGFRSSVLVQLAQIPVIATTGLTYKMIFGFGLPVVFGGMPLDLTFVIGSNSSLFLFPGGDVNSFGANLFPPIAIAYLIKRMRSGRTDSRSSDSPSGDSHAP